MPAREESEPRRADENRPGATDERQVRRAVLELTVRNHPGVLSHVCGLFARRAYNLEGVLCMPVGDGRTSRMWLLVEEDGRLSQVEKQIGKLVDVVELRRREGGDDAFARLGELLGE